MPDSYDSVPYTSYAYAYTHPDLLCVLGRLFGLSPAPPSRCRVLELGCASGGNSIPMAEQLPDSKFVGIDRSRVQIDRGRALVGELGLANIELQQADIMSLDAQTLGSFDYVICHGVFAWVPRPVQDRILELTAALLRPRGLAFVSYNVYPGWHMREMVRRMMLFHLRRFQGPDKQVEQARALADFVASSVKHVGAADDPYVVQLQRELATIEGMSDAYLFHEHLERDNSPLYFHEFVDRLRHLPLRYLCDSDLHLMVDRDMPDEVRETLGRIATDQVSMEQYLDFVRNRQFRTSVLCRSESAPQRRLQPERAQSLRFCMQGGASEPDPSLAPDLSVGFASSTGARFSSPASLTKAALIELGERWPASLGFDELLAAAQARVGAAGFAVEPDRERLAADLAADLIECLLRKAVTARADAAPLAVELPDRPRVSAFNRLTAAREGWLATSHHRRFELAAPLAVLVPLLDGTRDHAQLVAQIVALVRAGQLSIRTKDGAALEHGPDLDGACASFLAEQLAVLHELPALI
ncbi:methyltransferase regulatory domain-containing protein [Enhygromyxa salina]|uniref:Bifunctional 3-demethylubiquinone-9 3-methyltransferase/ 2-octaprenyl-6-hydroxy phenol methylase n=1 Tax=Enhygromyxa salina TaxID=215803 RepID=A0A2S9YR56_9BACT|nr:class I SAM-dependent methyltransferase [Enhygromyxa salina]PRQ07577.1 bifunctional 3-demethylubiquinone-9 3-methyltransferase/ 2-octaprenyl-6-hydroxy phenol methylase [Enhygromyxa salina]